MIDDRVARNRRKNATLVQSRVGAATKARLIREAAKRRLTLSALVSAILADYFVAPRPAKR